MGQEKGQNQRSKSGYRHSYNQ